MTGRSWRACQGCRSGSLRDAVWQERLYCDPGCVTPTPVYDTSMMLLPSVAREVVPHRRVDAENPHIRREDQHVHALG